MRHGRGLLLLALLVTAIFPGVACARESIRLGGRWEAGMGNADAPPSSMTAMAPAPVPSVYPWAPEGPHTVWYRTRFWVPPGWQGQRVILRLNGVKYSQRVYVNGQLVGSHVGGFEPTEYEIADRVRFGESNELLIGAEDWLSLLAEGTKVPATAAEAPIGSGVKGALMAPIGTAGGEVGIWGSVFLEARPRVWVQDVFVTPSVREGMLRVLVTVRNGGDREEAVKVTGRVANGGPGPQIPPVRTTLPPNSDKVVTLEAPWPKVQVWTPQDPHLYTLVVGSAAGAKVDSQTVRFGFRDFGIDGDTFLLNDTPLHLLGTYLLRSDASDLDPVATLKAAQAAGANAILLGGEPWPDVWYTAADELGLLVIAQSALSDLPSSYALDKDAFWKNVDAHVSATVQRLRNHPSVVIWSADDELLYAGGATVPGAVQKLGALAGTIHTLDPTRPVMFGGDFDPGGKADVINLHRPHELPRWRDWPETAFWFDSPVLLDNYPRLTWQWDHTKPLYLGRFLESPPSEVNTGSVLFGDAAYPDVDAARLAADAVAREWQISAARDAGVSGLGGWDLAAVDESTPAPGYAAVDAVDLSANDEVFAGSVVTRPIDVYNDSLTSRQLEVRWRLAPKDGAWSVAGQVPVNLDPGDREHIRADLALPPLAAAVTTAEYSVGVWEGDQKLSSHTAEWRVFGRGPLSGPIPGAPRHVAIYDPAGETTRLLSAFGIAPEALTSDNLERSLRWADVMVIGKDAFTDPRSTASSPLLQGALTFAQRGGTVLVFEQRVYPQWFFPVALTDRDSTITFARAPGHPVFAGLEDRDLAHWLFDGFVSRREIGKLDHVGFRTLIDSGGSGGLETAALAELKVGAGRLLLCQATVTTNAGVDPAATQLLRNLLAYAATKPVRSGATGVLAGPAARAALDAAGLKYEPVAPDFPRGRLDDNLLVIDNPNPDLLRLGASRLRDFVRFGGHVLLHNVTPQNAAAVAALVQQPLEVAANGEGAFRLVDRSGVAEGISNQEFAWFVNMPTAPASALSPDVVTNSIHIPTARDVVMHTEPGALASIRFGRGLWVIDQVRWDAPRGHGEEALRYLSTLLTNLGAEPTPYPPAPTPPPAPAMPPVKPAPVPIAPAKPAPTPTRPAPAPVKPAPAPSSPAAAPAKPAAPVAAPPRPTPAPPKPAVPAPPPPAGSPALPPPPTAPPAVGTRAA